MKKILKLGFIGGGINSAVGKVHFIASQMDKNFHVVSGVFSRDKIINYQTANLWAIEKNRTYSSIDKFIKYEKDKIDAVVLLSPSTDHFNVLLKLVKNRMPVICEKSFTTTLSEAREICKNAKKYKSYISLVYNYTGYPMIRELKELVRKKYFGDIKSIFIDMPQEGFITLDKNKKIIRPQSWRLKDGKIPTLSLDLGIHLFHLLGFLIQNKPQYITGMENSYCNFKTIVDDVKCLIKLERNATAAIWYSKSALGKKNGLSISVYGEKASAYWTQENAEKLELNNKLGNKVIIDRGSHLSSIANKERYARFKVGHPAGFIEAFANMYCDLAEDIKYYKKNGKRKIADYIFDENNGLEGLSLLTKLSQASKKNNWIKI